MRVFFGATAALVCLVAAEASAQSIHFTLEEALARARDQAPAVLVASALIEEARSRLVGTRVRFRDNPALDISGGPRSSDRGTIADLDVGLSQSFETGGQRAARMAGAEAAVAGERATTEDARRRAMAAVASHFVRTQHASERVQWLTAAEETASEIFRIATRRYEAGDIAVLDVNLARSALSRARSVRIAAEADRSMAAGELGRLLGLAGEAPVTDGVLDADRSADLPRLLAAADARPDLRALEAQVSEAEADFRLGRALQRPDIGVGVRAKRDGGDRVILGGFTVTFPAFNSGQMARAESSARASRLRLEHDTARATAMAEVRALHDAYVTRRSAAVVMAQDALPSGVENEQLSQRSFEEGQLSFAELLAVRRELVDTRLDYLDRLLEAADTAIARDAAAGVLQ